MGQIYVHVKWYSWIIFDTYKKNCLTAFISEDEFKYVIYGCIYILTDAWISRLPKLSALKFESILMCWYLLVCTSRLMGISTFIYTKKELSGSVFFFIPIYEDFVLYNITEVTGIHVEMSHIWLDCFRGNITFIFDILIF